MSFQRDLVLALSGMPGNRLNFDSGRKSRYLALKPIFRRVAADTGIPWPILAGVAWKESDFVATARNANTNASGLMQIMPMHFGSFGINESNWQNPEINIRAGAALIRQHGWGRLSIERTFTTYGGFVSHPEDGKIYTRDVTAYATYLMLSNITGEA